MADNRLELIVEVDASGANAELKGVNQDLLGFEKTAMRASERASTGFNNVGASAVKSRQSVNEFTRSGILGMERLEDEIIQSTNRVIALRQELAKHPERYNEISRSLQTATAQQRLHRTELRNLQFAQREANENAQVLASSLGVRLPDSMTRFLTRVPVVQRAMSGLFNATLIAGFTAAAGAALLGLARNATQLVDALREIPGAVRAGALSFESLQEAAGSFLGVETERGARNRAANVRGDFRTRAEQLERQNALIGLDDSERLRRQIEELRAKGSGGGLPEQQRLRAAEIGTLEAQLREAEKKITQARITERTAAEKKLLDISQSSLNAQVDEHARAMAQINQHENELIESVRQLRKAGTITEVEFQTSLTEIAALGAEQRGVIYEKEADAAIAARKRQAEFDKNLIESGLDILSRNQSELTQRNVQFLDIEAGRRDAEMQRAARLRAEQERAWQSLKNSAEGVLDALLDKSTSVWQAIANTFKATMLTAIKDVASSWIANFLAPVLGGGVRGGPGRTGAATGTLGSFAGILGGFGGGGFGIPGVGPGGTPPFLPSTVTTTGGGVSPASGLANFGAMGGNLRNFLGIGGNAAAGGIGPTLPFGQMGLGGKLSAIGKSDAALLGGALLAMDGIRRGGVLGLAETTGGGALIGFRFGGPVGAAIGAGIGAAVGVFGLFRKSAEKKAREKIKATYGVDIEDKGILRQIVETAKSGFGGNLDVTIRSPQIRELVELYGMSTGQAGRFPSKLQPVGLFQSGGNIFQAQSFTNGVAQPSSALSVGLSNSQPTVHVHETIPIALDGQPFRELAVDMIISNGRVVESSVSAAEQESSGRRERAARLLRPGLITTAPGNR